MKITVENLAAFSAEALRKAGLGPEEARLSAEALVTTDTWGVFTHGTKNLAGYIRRIKAGGIRAGGVPKTVAEGPAWAMVDGDSALGMVASSFAANVAAEKARKCGLGYAGLRHSCHFGAAGYYAWLIAKQGMIGVAMSNDTPTVTVPGARNAVLGSNPLAYAIPVEGENPILLDMATSTVAGGKVFTAAARGESIPDHWLVDAEGLPTTNPKIFPEAGSLTPMAGHKGYGIALLIETLSAVLTGASIAGHVLSWSFADASLPTNHGAAFVAIDTDAMMPKAEFQNRLRQTIREIREAPKAKGCDRIYVPGEMEWERRDRALAEGIDLPEEISERLKALAAELGLRSPF